MRHLIILALTAAISGCFTIPSLGGDTAKLTADELDALRAQLAQCWVPPNGWTDPSQVRVVALLSLSPDGSVRGQPDILEAPQGQYASEAPASAIRAIDRCAPFKLPANKYDAWKQVKVIFDPRDQTPQNTAKSDFVEWDQQRVDKARIQGERPAFRQTVTLLKCDAK